MPFTVTGAGLSRQRRTLRPRWSDSGVDGDEMFDARKMKEISTIQANLLFIKNLGFRSVSSCCRRVHWTVMFSDIQIAICTSGSRCSTLHTLQVLQLSSLVSTVMCGDDAASLPKPDPRNIVTICDRLKVSPCQTVSLPSSGQQASMAPRLIYSIYWWYTVGDGGWHRCITGVLQVSYRCATGHDRRAKGVLQVSYRYVTDVSLVWHRHCTGVLQVCYRCLTSVWQVSDGCRVCRRWWWVTRRVTCGWRRERVSGWRSASSAVSPRASSCPPTRPTSSPVSPPSRSSSPPRCPAGRQGAPVGGASAGRPHRSSSSTRMARCSASTRCGRRGWGRSLAGMLLFLATRTWWCTIN